MDPKQTLMTTIIPNNKVLFGNDQCGMYPVLKVNIWQFNKCMIIFILDLSVSIPLTGISAPVHWVEPNKTCISLDYFKATGEKRNRSFIGEGEGAITVKVIYQMLNIKIISLSCFIIHLMLICVGITIKLLF